MGKYSSSLLFDRLVHVKCSPICLFDMYMGRGPTVPCSLLLDLCNMFAKMLDPSQSEFQYFKGSLVKLQKKAVVDFGKLFCQKCLVPLVALLIGRGDRLATVAPVRTMPNEAVRDASFVSSNFSTFHSSTRSLPKALALRSRLSLFLFLIRFLHIWNAWKSITVFVNNTVCQ